MKLKLKFKIKKQRAFPISQLSYTMKQKINVSKWFRTLRQSKSILSNKSYNKLYTQAIDETEGEVVIYDDLNQQTITYNSYQKYINTANSKINQLDGYIKTNSNILQSNYNIYTSSIQTINTVNDSYITLQQQATKLQNTMTYISQIIRSSQYNQTLNDLNMMKNYKYTNKQDTVKLFVRSGSIKYPKKTYKINFSNKYEMDTFKDNYDLLGTTTLSFVCSNTNPPDPFNITTTPTTCIFNHANTPSTGSAYYVGVYVRKKFPIENSSLYKTISPILQFNYSASNDVGLQLRLYQRNGTYHQIKDFKTFSSNSSVLKLQLYKDLCSSNKFKQIIGIDSGSTVDIETHILYRFAYFSFRFYIPPQTSITFTSNPLFYYVPYYTNYEYIDIKGII